MIIIQQETLNAALTAVTRASLKSSLAALSLVRIDAYSNGVLHLSCFNGETAARAIVQVSCKEQISVCVDALTLKAVVETLASEIELFMQESSLEHISKIVSDEDDNGSQLNESEVILKKTIIAN